jgi:cytidylate kinase
MSETESTQSYSIEILGQDATNNTENKGQQKTDLSELESQKSTVNQANKSERKPPRRIFTDKKPLSKRIAKATVKPIVVKAAKSEKVQKAVKSGLQKPKVRNAAISVAKCPPVRKAIVSVAKGKSLLVPITHFFR